MPTQLFLTTGIPVRLPEPTTHGEAKRTLANAGEYADVPGFCKSANLEEIQKHGHVLTPGRYVGAADVVDDGEPFEDKMQRMTAELYEGFSESGRLQETIQKGMVIQGDRSYRNPEKQDEE